MRFLLDFAEIRLTNTVLVTVLKSAT